MPLTRKVEPREAKDIVLGHEYTDAVTGISGVAVIAYVHLSGCDQVSLEYVDNDKVARFLTVDITRLEGVKVKDANPGGPGAAVPSRLTR